VEPYRLDRCPSVPKGAVLHCGSISQTEAKLFLLWRYLQPKESVVKKFLVLIALSLSFALANPWTIGVTYNPVTPNNGAVGMQVDYGMGDVEVAGLDARWAVRFDATLPLTFDLMPSTNLAVQLQLPQESFTAYAGTGIGVWIRKIADEPCYDVTWTFHAGVDVPVWNTLALRAEVQAAPLIGGWNLGVGLAYALPAN